MGDGGVNRPGGWGMGGKPPWGVGWVGKPHLLTFGFASHGQRVG